MKKLLYLTALIMFSSCIRKTDNCGYSFEEADLNEIQVGITTQENVLREFGSPSIKSKVDEQSKEVWIYYSDVKHSYFFFRPTVNDKKVLAITFNDENVVSSKEQKGMENINGAGNIRIVRDYTKTKDNSDNVFVDIMNNIGTVTSM